MGVDYYITADQEEQNLVNHLINFANNLPQQSFNINSDLLSDPNLDLDSSTNLDLNSNIDSSINSSINPISITSLSAADRKIYEDLRSIVELEKLEEIVNGLDCISLRAFANNTVFADGNPESDIMLVGEAPGASEDKEGVPFCGESGQLLDIIFRSINLSRKENLYITNTVFWRPPANRKPTQDEINICRPYLEKHIALIKPKLIILVGNTAIETVTNSQFNSKYIRENFLTYKNYYLDNPIHITGIFHPAYLLRQPYKKKDMFFKLLEIQNFLNSN